MPVELSADTPAPLLPLGWLIGRWEGVGVVGYPSMDGDLRFGQEVSFSHDGRPFLSYTSRTWLLDASGGMVRPLAGETGFWRPAGTSDGGKPGLEVLLAHPSGFVETYYGHLDGARAELVTDVVARTPTAKEYNAAHRLYGLVEGDLMWVMEMAAVGHPLTAHVSARLRRVG
ncbi:MAG TPA: FABP family protein [Kineosporiaceae bacterium]